MQIEEINMRNFRGIIQGDLTLRGQSAVFFGTNGAGKTSILEGIATLLSRLIGGITHSSAGRRQFIETDIAFGRQTLTNNICVKHKERYFTWSISKQRKGSTNSTSDESEMKDLVEDIRNSLIYDEYASVPIAVYYPVNRAVLDIPLRIRKRHIFNQLSAYDKALTSGADFRIFFEWYRNREDLENQQKVRLDKSYIDTQLDTVRRAIYAFLPGFKDLKVDRDPLRMVIKKNNRTFEISQLSDGEQCMLAMVGDLARRLALANSGTGDPLFGFGVVLIDEIELHLHPEWQRKVIPSLCQTFPNVQFITTTHSPQVLGELKDEHIYRLEETDKGVRISSVPNMFGRDSNQILRDFMHTSEKNSQINSLLLRLYSMIHDKQWNQANELINELSKQIGTDYPDLIKAQTLMTRIRSINR